MQSSFFHIRSLCIFCLLLLLFKAPAQESGDLNVSEAKGLLLEDLLPLLQKTFSVHFLYESELLANIPISPFKVKEKKGLEYNLDLLLADTPITYIKVGDETFVLVQIAKKGMIYGSVAAENLQLLTGATIRILGEQTGVTSDAKGAFRLQVAPGVHRIEVRHVGYKPIVKSIAIAPRDSVLMDFVIKDNPSLEEVVVVGSRFVESALIKKAEPADIVKAEDLSFNGHAQVTEQLQYLVPSFHATPQTISDGTDHIIPATLRGLGPDQLLVLINGKRRHHSALVNINGTVGKGSVATDLNSIPSAAIERIEILRDGAATEYGSDAIAGVINIILKKNTNFVDLNLSSGITTRGDGANFNLSGNYGLPLGVKGGFLNLSLHFSHVGAINRSGAYGGPVFGDGRDQRADSLQLFFEQAGFGDQRVMSIGRAETSNAGLFINMEVPTANGVVFYSTAGSNYRIGKSGGFYRFPYQKTRQAGLYTFGFSPKLHSNIFDRSITVGVKAALLPWKVDFSNTTGNNRFDFSVKNSNNASLGLASPTSVRAGGFSYTQNVTNLDINRSIKGPIPMQLGVGSEFRLESYRQDAGEEASWVDGKTLTAKGAPRESGIQMFPGFHPENEVQAYRYNLGLYTTLEGTITKDLSINTAVRFEYYSDFGSSTIWKTGIRYALNKHLTFRSTFNTGLRAPSMPQIYFNSKATQFISDGEDLTGINVTHFNNVSNVPRLFGIQALKPERSRNFSGGIASQLGKNLSFTIDVFNVDIVDRIIITGRFSKEDDPRFEQILAPFESSKAQFFTNSIDTQTKGLDLILHYKIKLSKYLLRFYLASNISNTRLKTDAEGQAIIKASPLLQGFEHIIFNREEISRIEDVQPNSKSIFSMKLQSQKLELFLATTRFGKVIFIHPEDGNSSDWVVNDFTGQKASRDQVFSPKWITDLSLRYHFSAQATIELGANNLFNIYPDQHQHSANIDDGLFLYSRRVQQFGVSGTYVYTKFNFRF